jgi:threonine synthase
LVQTYNVTEQEILNAIGRAAINHVTAEDIVVLIATGQAIKDGDTTVDEAFRSTRVRPTPQTKEQKELERMKLLIGDCKDLKSLEKLQKEIKGNDALMELYLEKEAEFLTPEKK